MVWIAICGNDCVVGQCKVALEKTLTEASVGSGDENDGRHGEGCLDL